MPYGEELIRVRDLPVQVEQAVAHLESVNDGNVSAALAYKRFQTALSVIDDARRTLDDCKRLPDEHASRPEDE